MRDKKDIREEVQKVELLIDACGEALRTSQTEIHERMMIILRKSEMEIYLRGVRYALGETDSLEWPEENWAAERTAAGL